VTPYLTTQQAADHVGDVSSRTIVDWIHRGRLKAVRNPSERGRFKILLSDLEAAMRGEYDVPDTQTQP
jgi:excisionase family DNA binding protein